jgi:hypothetical protein
MKTAVASSADIDSARAGQELSDRICSGMGASPKALIVFAAPTYDHAQLLNAMAQANPDTLIVGASSAGEFMNEHRGEGLACAVGLSGDDATFNLSYGLDVGRDPAGAAKQIAAGFRGVSDFRFPHRSALVLSDVLAGHADKLVDELTLATAGQYQFFGGGAGDNARFERTSVFCGREVLNGAVVALEILSDKPIGVGVRHGWEPASKGLRATEVNGARLVSLNGLPTVEAFQAHAEQTGQVFDPSAPIPFFLHNILGVQTPAGHRLRVPLAILDDGAVLCAAEIQEGAVVHIMRTSDASAVLAAEHATEAALERMHDHPPQAALFFDCVATRLRMGRQFDQEISLVRERLSGADLIGCNTHGQIARAEGQFEGFHNCTAVVAILPA